LTGAGTAPELMAEAVFALDRVGRLHNLSIRETHATFGGVALARAGQLVPTTTRTTILGADAVLVAGAEEPALNEVLSDLDVRAQATWVSSIVNPWRRATASSASTASAISSGAVPAPVTHATAALRLMRAPPGRCPRPRRRPRRRHAP
jgi:hypothetical protein